MSATIVKICGVRSVEVARVVAENGADLMGLIFAPSRRQVTADEARAIVSSLDCFATRPKVVGVFVNETAEFMNAVAERVGLDFIQLSGDEPASIQAEINRPVIRVLRLPDGTPLPNACRAAEGFLDCASPAATLMLDTHVAGIYGGTGKQGDWNLARELAERFPVILSGGLRPDTVEEAIEFVSPLGVDVSSGVETNGEKDPAKIRQLLARTRSVEIRSGNNVVTSRG